MPIELPALKQPLKIISQSEELARRLAELEGDKALVWGAETNGINVGIAHGILGKSGTRLQDITVYIRNHGTNDLMNQFWRLPEPDELPPFELELYGADGGKIVAKPVAGSKPAPVIQNRIQGGHRAGSFDGFPAKINGVWRTVQFLSLPTNQVMRLTQFHLLDYFDIKKPGRYQLIYRQRFYGITHVNSELINFLLPPVSMTVDLDPSVD